MSAIEQTSAQQFEEKTSTVRKPYHYVGSGLGNVYLVGVTYRYWPDSQLQSADIPCLPALLQALAKALVGKRSALNGDELRFLRKQLRVPSKDFAAYVGLSAEQYSRLENGATVTPTVERLVRLLYVALAELPSDAAREVARTIWTAELDHSERIIASQDENHNWIVKTKAA
jgi:transcriptional regulator with XRE-family HTH domain